MNPPGTTHDQAGGVRSGFEPATMTKDERSIVLYLETCLVDAGGLVEGVRMNTEDHANIERLSKAGLLRVYRIPACLLGTGANSRWTHMAHFAPAGWSLAHQLRRARAEQVGPYGLSVVTELKERGKWGPLPDTSERPDLARDEPLPEKAKGQ